MKPVKQKNANSLWTKDFTILTLGSVVSMLGSSLTGFAMSLLVLDYTGSTLLYAIYIALYTIPQIVMPIFSGAILDRFSRRKTIYMLDFITGGLYVAAAFILAGGWFSFPVLALFNMLIGAIGSIYNVAYQSFYPLLIREGNYSKAYSISGLLENLTFFMVPLSALLYNTIGIVPLFIVDAVSYLLAAVMETRITAREDYIDVQRASEENRPDRSSGRRLLSDVKEGFQYLTGNRGLLAVAVYFGFSALTGGASSALTLPWFESAFPNGEYLFILVDGALIVGRSIGAAILYRVKLPVERKFAIAFAVYLSIAVINGVYLFLPVWLMILLMLLYGLLGVTSYTIRISATQSYVPDEKKGRFNGAFAMISTVGSLSGTVLAGALSTVAAPRLVLLGFCAVEALSAILLIGARRAHIAPIYNRQQ